MSKKTEPVCIHKLPVFDSAGDAMRAATRYNYANETGPRRTTHLCGDGKYRLAEFPEPKTK